MFDINEIMEFDINEIMEKRIFFWIKERSNVSLSYLVLTLECKLPVFKALLFAYLMFYVIYILNIYLFRYIDMAESLCQKRALEAFHLDPEKWGGNWTKNNLCCRLGEQ